MQGTAFAKANGQMWEGGKGNTCELLKPISSLRKMSVQPCTSVAHFYGKIFILSAFRNILQYKFFLSNESISNYFRKTMYQLWVWAFGHSNLLFIELSALFTLDAYSLL